MVTVATAVPGIVLGQSMKSEIVGSWQLISVVDQYDSGERVNNWGSAKGNMTFDAGGRFSQIIIGDAQPALKTADPRKPDAPVVAYYGTYTVDEAKKTLAVNIEAASWSARVGASFPSSVEVKDGVMKMVGGVRKDQMGQFRPVLELKRAPSL